LRLRREDWLEEGCTEDIRLSIFLCLLWSWILITLLLRLSVLTSTSNVSMSHGRGTHNNIIGCHVGWPVLWYILHDI